MKRRTVSASTSCWSAAGSPGAPGRTVFNLDEALAAADEIGLPVLMRPSYVLGGQNMIVAYTKADVIEYMGVITEHVDMDHPVLLDKYILGTECEVDAICDGENFLIPGIMEQVERTGVHSGDSICVYPAQHLTQAEIDTMVDYTGRFARELHVTGLVNVQYAVSNGKVYVIEVNPRFLPYRAVYLQGHRRAQWWIWRCAVVWAKAGRYGLRHRPAPQRTPMWPSRCLCSALKSCTVWIPSSAPR